MGSYEFQRVGACSVVRHLCRVGDLEMGVVAVGAEPVAVLRGMNTCQAKPCLKLGPICLDGQNAVSGMDHKGMFKPGKAIAGSGL